MSSVTPTCGTYTRRRWLQQTGTLGMIGIAQAGCVRDREDSWTTNESTMETQTGDTPVLETGQPADAGMSVERLSEITDHLRSKTRTGDITSASVLVARHGKVVLHGGFGELNADPKAPATQPDTTYLLASISKPVSVCGLMLLVDRGEVDLSDPVKRYLPEFHGDDRDQVKIWHLLSHTSGLPDMLPENVELRRSHAPLSEFVARALRTPLLYPPGTQFAYQSMGTLLAAEITERVSGARLRDFLRREIFEALDMKHTVLGLDGLRIEDTAIVQEKDADAKDARRWGPNSSYWRNMGHPWGGLHSTTGDLAILLQTFLNGGEYGGVRLLSPETTTAMIRDRNRSIGAPWGLGWALRDSYVWNFFGSRGSPHTFGHVGATGTVAWADPERQLIVVLLTTSPRHKKALLNSISDMAQAAVVKT